MSGEIEIIYEDEYVLICSKPHGLMVEPDRNNYPNLLQWVKNYLKTKTGDGNVYAQHLHRLDRPVTGLVLFVKQREYLHCLSNQFAERKVEKYYYALTENAPVQSSGTLINWHRKEKKKGNIVLPDTSFAEEVKLDYNVKPYNNYFLWHIVLHTGKFHQIRAQLAFAGCPIIGDSLYGSGIFYKENAIALQAYHLGFFHPAKNEKISIDIDLSL